MVRGKRVGELPARFFRKSKNENDMHDLKMARGRPKKFTPTEVAEALRAAHGLRTHAAKILGCTIRTIDNYCQRFATCRDACEDARRELLDLGEARLWKRVDDGEGWAVCFLLKTLGKNRGYVERHEMTGPDGGEIPIRFIEVVLNNSNNGDAQTG